MQTIDDKLRTSGGIGQGFDFLRLALAVGVVAWHSNGLVSGGAAVGSMPIIWFPGYAILTMFFALSGFLIAGSAQRLRLTDFLINRGLRIFPALLVEIVLSAFILGLVLTSLTASAYISNAETWRYLTNIVAIINYTLPGVFDKNPTNIVNGALWTVPFEFLCYGVMSIIILTKTVKSPRFVFAIGVAIIVIGLALQFFALGGPAMPAMVTKTLDRLFVGHHSRLLLAFLFGIAAYCARERIPYSNWLAAGALTLCLLVAYLGPADRLGYPIINLLAAPALVYLTVYVGVSNVPTPALFKKGDYSYGIYLYGYPMQQVMVGAIPSVTSALVQFFIALPVIAMFSAFSWHAIEKPVLKIRKRFSFVSRMRLAEDAADPTHPTIPRIAAKKV